MNYLSFYLTILSIQGQDGATPLRCAVQEGQAGVVAVLLANGGNVDELVSIFHYQKISFHTHSVLITMLTIWQLCCFVND